MRAALLRRARIGLPSVLLILGALSFVAWSCRSASPRSGATERGVASWYGHPFHGRQTASGEPYDMEELTAAHRTLPFGTLVEVENLDNGLQVVVRINDRGPFAKGRIIDLSRAAARQIRMIGPGTARVELRVVGSHTSDPRAVVVQVGAFRERGRAESLVEDLRRRGYEAAIMAADGFFRVRLEAGGDRRQAETLRGALVALGYPAILVVLGSP